MNKQNELNELEMQLRSWAPRRPSGRLKRRLFGRPQEQETSPGSFRWSWLPPATAAMLLLCVLFNQHSSQALSPAGSNSIIAVALSNQSVAPWLEGSFCRVHNTLPCSTFEWTNRDRSSSGIRSGTYPNVTN